MANVIYIELDEKTLRQLVATYIAEKLGDSFVLDDNAIQIEVKSRQNYKSEWEEAAFRATYRSSSL